MRTRDPPAADGSSLPAVRALGHFTLNVKLMAAFLAVALIPIVLLFCLDVRRARATLTENADQALLSAASQTADGIGSFIDGNLDAIGVEAQLPDFIEYLSLPPRSRKGGLEEIEAASVLFTLARKDQADIFSYALLDDRGRILLDTYTPDIGIDASEEDFFVTPVKTGAPFASPVEFFDGDMAFIVFSAPVRDTAAGDIVGVLCMRFSAGILEQIVVHDDGLAGRLSYAILLDENRLCLADGNTPDAIFKSLAAVDPMRGKGLKAERRLPNLPGERPSAYSAAFNKALLGARPRSFFTIPPDEAGGASYSAAAAGLSGQPWLVIFVQPQSVSLSPLRAQVRDAVVLALAIAAAVACVSAVIVKFLTIPIVGLTAVARRVAQGDMSAKVKVGTADEIGVLSDTFNVMTEELHQSLEKLRTLVAEKEILLKETHHRVKNNLQMVISILSLQASSLAEGEAHDAIMMSRNRIYAIASIHNQLCFSENLTAINLGENLDLLLDDIAHMYNRPEITVIRRMGDVFLDLGISVSCGLIANELVVNAFKHAFPAGAGGSIEIEVRRSDGGSVTLSVGDDGIGFPGDIDFRTMQSLGMNLVVSLTAQISGTIELDRSRGTKFIIRFNSTPALSD